MHSCLYSHLHRHITHTKYTGTTLVTPVHIATWWRMGARLAAWLNYIGQIGHNCSSDTAVSLHCCVTALHPNTASLICLGAAWPFRHCLHHHHHISCTFHCMFCFPVWVWLELFGVVMYIGRVVLKHKSSIIIYVQVAILFHMFFALHFGVMSSHLGAIQTSGYCCITYHQKRLEAVT